MGRVLTLGLRRTRTRKGGRACFNASSEVLISGNPVHSRSGPEPVYVLHLQLKALAFGVKATRQDQQKTRLEVVEQVRRAYYCAVVHAQSALDSLEASLPYCDESKRLAAENPNRETILASDFLGVDAQLLKTQNAVSDAKDQAASASERLNDLIGPDIYTQFRSHPAMTRS